MVSLPVPVGVGVTPRLLRAARTLGSTATAVSVPLSEAISACGAGAAMGAAALGAAELPPLLLPVESPPQAATPKTRPPASSPVVARRASRMILLKSGPGQCPWLPEQLLTIRASWRRHRMVAGLLPGSQPCYTADSFDGSALGGRPWRAGRPPPR